MRTRNLLVAVVTEPSNAKSTLRCCNPILGQLLFVSIVFKEPKLSQYKNAHIANFVLALISKSISLIKCVTLKCNLLIPLNFEIQIYQHQWVK